jgi:hypothetical protein
MHEAREGIALGKLGQVEPGAEMLALAGEHDGADVLRQHSEEALDAVHGRIVENVAFCRAREFEHSDRAMPLCLQGRRQIGEFGSRGVHGATVMAEALPAVSKYAQ